MYRVHNSTVSKQLCYSLMRESVLQPVSWDEVPYAVVVECKLRGGQCREKYEKYMLKNMLKKEKILMTKNCLYATINSKHYISVSGTT